MSTFDIGGIKISGDLPDELGLAIDIKKQIMTNAAMLAVKGQIVAIKDGDVTLGIMTPAGWFSGERLVAQADGRLVIR